MADIRTNLLYFGDNLTWLRNRDRFPDESVDLVYLDPPFNSNRSYNVLFKEADVRDSEAQMHAFEDTWSWDIEGRVQAVFDEFWLNGPDKPKQMLKSMIDALGRNDVTAYLTIMAPRLVELRRVLKPTGSLYQHCDPTASHYLKMLLDSIFGPKSYRNEITWKRTSAHSDTKQGMKRYGRIRDTILFYTKSTNQSYTWNDQYTEYRAEYAESEYRHIAPDSRRYKETDLTAAKPGGDTEYEWRVKRRAGSKERWQADLDDEYLSPVDGQKYDGVRPYRGRYWAYSKANLIGFSNAGILIHRETGMPRLMQFEMEMLGIPLQDLWDDIPPASSAENLGYATQKPIALLERIVEASSGVGGVILDPFCGCGTAVHAAQKLERQWIGIDITPLATNLIRDRLESYSTGLKVPIEGWPSDMAGAIALAALDDKYHFQDWAVIECGARPAGGERRKGADRGIDGVIPFLDGSKPMRGVVSVKAGATGPSHVRDLAGVVSPDPDTAFGVFVCLHPPTRAMIEEALSHGTWVSDFDTKTYPKIQILSAHDLLDGLQVRMPEGRAPSCSPGPRVSGSVGAHRGA